MASQTKVEPEAAGPGGAVPPAGGPPTADAPEGGGYAMDGDEAADPATSADATSMPLLASDDEDVALEELMVSDLSDLDDDDDEPEEATEVHAGLGRLRDEVYSSDELLTPPPQTVDADVLLELSEMADDEAAALAAASAAQEAVARAADEERERAAATLAEPDGQAEPDVELAAQDANDGIAAEATAGSDDAAPDTLQAVVSLDSETDLPSTPSLSVEAAEPATTSEPIGVKLRDAPLPSFEIPEGEAAEDEGATASPSVESRSSGRGSARPMAPLAPLSEVVEDDDDDVVTHIGLPVPETAGGYSEFEPGGFQVADTGMAAMQGFDNLNLLDTRRATTRLVPRINPSQLDLGTPPPTDYLSRVLGSLSAAVGAGLSRLRGGSAVELEPEQTIGDQPPQRLFGWLRDKVLPPLSLVLAGSGIGAGILLLQIDRDGDPSAEQAQTVQALKGAPGSKPGTTLVDRAEAGDSDALFKITNMADAERTSALTLAAEAGHQARKLNEFNEFARSLQQPAAAGAPNSMARLIGYATSPETMLPAFRHLSQWAGSRGPDVLYAVWEKAPGGSRAASLAQQLLSSADQRSKATPALTTALDLRAATACEDYLRLLPKVLSTGDQRCSATLRALKHTDGCGDDGHSDCYACLREGRLLDDALAAIEKRPAPQL